MEVTAVPTLYDNYTYIVYNNVTRDAMVIDPSEAWPIIGGLAKSELRLKAVLCTHHHQDHVGGLDDLMDEFPEIPVFGFRGDVARLAYLSELIENGDTFELCGTLVEVEHTPGHTTGAVVYHIEEYMFTGDTLFGAGCGRLFEGSPKQMMDSLAKLTDRAPTTKIYAGHEYTLENLRFARQLEPGNQEITRRLSKVEGMRGRDLPSMPSTIAEELGTNPFLRWAEPQLISHLELNYSLQNTKPETVFALLRELRNNYS